MPVGEDSLVAEERVIGGEQDALGKPPRDLALQFIGEVSRRPTVQLAPDIRFVQRHRDHLALPRPGRPRCNNRQIGKAGGDRIQMARMTGIEDDAGAAGQPRAEPGRADKNERRRFGLDAKPIETAPKQGRSPAARPNRRRRGRQTLRRDRGSGETRPARERRVRVENEPDCR